MKERTESEGGMEKGSAIKYTYKITWTTWTRPTGKRKCSEKRLAILPGRDEISPIRFPSDHIRPELFVAQHLSYPLDEAVFILGDEKRRQEGQDRLKSRRPGRDQIYPAQMSTQQPKKKILKKTHPGRPTQSPPPPLQTHRIPPAKTHPRASTASGTAPSLRRV